MTLDALLAEIEKRHERDVFVFGDINPRPYAHDYVPRLVAALRYAEDAWLREVLQSEYGPKAADAEREKIAAILRGEKP